MTAISRRMKLQEAGQPRHPKAYQVVRDFRMAFFACPPDGMLLVHVAHAPGMVQDGSQRNDSLYQSVVEWL